MKIWLGIIGRALIEFVIILALVSIAAGMAQSLGLPSGGMRFIYISAASAALSLSPLAALITLFLAFFAFALIVWKSEVRTVKWHDGSIRTCSRSSPRHVLSGQGILKIRFKACRDNTHLGGEK